MQGVVLGAGWLGKRISQFLDIELVDYRVNTYEDLKNFLIKKNPSLVINCIGRTGRPHIDWCETHKEETTFANVTVPQMLSQACEELGIYLVHIGSGCEYQGDNNGKGWLETDNPNFYGSFYSTTKIISENILKKNSNCLQLRIRMPIDSIPNERNYINKIRKYSKLIEEKNSMTIILDFLVALEKLIQKKARGVYNVVNPGLISAVEVMNLYKEIVSLDVNFQVINNDELNKMVLAPRSNCMLNTDKLDKEGCGLLDIKESLKKLLVEYKKNLESENSVKGIILAGGKATRLFPATNVVCKQLLPVYDKPMIYYPLSVLMLAGIKDILIITTPDDKEIFKKLLGNGSHLGINISYKVQDQPRGLADAFIVGESFIGNNRCCLILGDNILYGHGLLEILERALKRLSGATVFGYHVNDPERYGVVEFEKKVVYGDSYKVVSIEEKPKIPKSNYAVVGLYFYDNKVVDIAKSLKPSARGEIEITDLNVEYLKKGQLNVELFGRGFAWLDTGTHESMLDAGNYVAVTEKRQGLKIGCVEEIAYFKGYINKEQLRKIAEPLRKSGYGEYLLKLIE